MIRKTISVIFKLLKMFLCTTFDGIPLKFKKKDERGPQFTSTDQMSLVSTLLSIGWTFQSTRCQKSQPNKVHLLCVREWVRFGGAEGGDKEIKQ